MVSEAHMNYFVKHDLSGNLIAIGIGNGGTTITEAEYNTILAEIREKAILIDKLYINEITINDVPEAWREEVQRKVDERIAEQGNIDKQELSAEEALNIILGGET